MTTYDFFNKTLYMKGAYEKTVHNQIQGSLGTAYISQLHTEKTLEPDNLVRANVKLAFYVAKKYSESGYELDDLVSTALVGLVKAACAFEPERGYKFATFASTCIYNEINMFLRKERKERKFEQMYLDDTFTAENDGNQIMYKAFAKDANDYEDIVIKKMQLEELDEIIGALSEQERILLIDYSEKVHQRATSQKLGLSQSYISRLQKQLIKKLRNKYNQDIEEIKPTTLKNKMTIK